MYIYIYIYTICVDCNTHLFTYVYLYLYTLTHAYCVVSHALVSRGLHLKRRSEPRAAVADLAPSPRHRSTAASEHLPVKPCLDPDTEAQRIKNENSETCPPISHIGPCAGERKRSFAKDQPGVSMTLKKRDHYPK